MPGSPSRRDLQPLPSRGGSVEHERMTTPLRAAAVAGALLLTLALVPAGTAAAALAGAAPQCPAAAGNARYVRFVYLEILDRCPDAGGLGYWTRRLDAGTSRWGVADAIDMSTENLGRNNVDQLYQLLLDRPPTTAERAAGIARLRAGHENATLTTELLSSDEGYGIHGTGATPAERDRAWLAYAYNRILDRAPDPLGESFYLGYFASSGSTAARRHLVAMGLEHSYPNATSWVKATMAEALGRPADPRGLAYWRAWLTDPSRGRWQTFRLWTMQLASDEAYRRSQTQP